MKTFNTALLLLGLLSPIRAAAPLEWSAPSASQAEFAGNWIEPNTAFCQSEWISGPDGRYHRGRILKPNLPGTTHRAYPTWQFGKTIGRFGPATVSFDFRYWVPPMDSTQWLSLLTLARKNDDADWDPVCVNVNQQGDLYIMHAPAHGQQVYTILGPTKLEKDKWYHMDVDVDFRASGYVVVSIDGRARLSAPFNGALGLEAGHAGMYAEGSLPGGYIDNSNIIVRERPIARSLR